MYHFHRRRGQKAELQRVWHMRSLRLITGYKTITRLTLYLSTSRRLPLNKLIAHQSSASASIILQALSRGTSRSKWPPSTSLSCQCLPLSWGQPIHDTVVLLRSLVHSSPPVEERAPHLSGKNTTKQYMIDILALKGHKGAKHVVLWALLRYNHTNNNNVTKLNAIQQCPRINVQPWYMNELDNN